MHCPRLLSASKGNSRSCSRPWEIQDSTKKDRADIVAANDRLEELKRLLAEAYARWEELEQIRLDGENSRLSK